MLFQVYFIFLLFPNAMGFDHSEKMKLVDIKSIETSIEVDMRYYSNQNFIGRRIDGYRTNKCLVTPPTALALAKAQKSLKKLGFSLILFDCYRPQRAVDDFVAWSKDLEDQKFKSTYYPNIAKNQLFEKGYIAEKSGHSRGSTVDLGLKKKGEEELVDMGTIFDFFGERSHTLHLNIPAQAKTNRRILLRAMESAGFKNYSKEWWHFTLKNEPNKKVYMDTLVQ